MPESLENLETSQGSVSKIRFLVSQKSMLCHYYIQIFFSSIANLFAYFQFFQIVDEYKKDEVEVYLACCSGILIELLEFILLS